MQSIKVMPDYGCHPLWANDLDEVGDIDPADLPISALLISELNKWASDFDLTLNDNYPPDSGFSNQECKAKFVVKGFELASTLKDELKSVIVVYYDIDKMCNVSI